MICLNCGRPNPSGTSLCDRCRERRPGLERARGGVIYQRTRETARVRRRGSGILVGAVLFLAALIFAGGTVAVFLGPRGATPTAPGIAFDPEASASRLEIFEQQTATPAPTPVPTPPPTAWFPSPTPDDRPCAHNARPVRHANRGPADAAGSGHATADKNASHYSPADRDAYSNATPDRNRIHANSAARQSRRLNVAEGDPHRDVQPQDPNDTDGDGVPNGHGQLPSVPLTRNQNDLGSRWQGNACDPERS